MDPRGLLMIGAVLAGGFLALPALKGFEAEVPGTGALTALSTTPLGHEAATRAEGSPAAYLVHRAWGVIAEGPVAAHDRGPAVFIADAIRDWRPADDSEVVARVQMLREQPDCAMPPPAAGARVVPLTVEHPATKSGLYSFSEADILESVDTWFERIRRSAETPRVPGPVASHEYRVHDIAVTETAAPVHLVLQNLAPTNMLYNLHLAPGATVSGVSLLGGEANAVAGLADDVPVAVMTRDTLAACGVAIRDAARGEAGIETRIREHTLSTEDEITAARAELAAGIVAHEAWFRAQFGIAPTEGRMGLSFAEVSLIGPVVADPPAYRPLAGAHVRAQAQAYFRVEGLHPWPETYREEVVRLGTVLAGGDPLEVVRPLHLAQEF